MKYKVGDILRSKENMIINIEPDSDDEKVNEGDYFVVVDYGKYEQLGEKCVGWTLISQKNMTLSRWDKDTCVLEENFVKE